MDEVMTVDRIKKHFVYKRGLFQKRRSVVKAVDDVSFTIYKGETLGIIGESGCGKSTLAKLMMRLAEPTENRILYKGKNIYSLSKEEVKEYRKQIGMVFQDPASSLHPKATIRQALARQLIVNGVDKKEINNRIQKTLEAVGLDHTFLDRYPYQLSGGQQQRVSIARAILLRSEFIILDEPTSALDVSVQAQILNLLLDLQEAYNLTYLFITHNLHVVRYMSDRIGVMYLGRLVEIGPAEDVCTKPAHPYTYGLMSASPTLSPKERGREKFTLSGELPSVINPPNGCRLHPRCPYKIDRCATEVPQLQPIGQNHYVACHRAPLLFEGNESHK